MDFEIGYAKFVIEALKEASGIANRNFKKVKSVSVKQGDNNQVLTETDLEIGSFLIEKISRFYPDHNIIDEEAGVINKNSDYTWVIDPIDGTSNFASQTPLYGIIIGLLHKAFPMFGGIALPFFNEIIIAEKGKGAYCNRERMSVSKENRLLSSLVAYGIDGYQNDPGKTHNECKILSDIILSIRSLRMAGSVFDGVMVAKGRYGAFLNKTSKIWDNVGQQIIIEEAGGIYTDFFGYAIDYSNPLNRIGENFTFCAGAPELHKHLQEIIHKNGCPSFV